ncbi:MarR family winged helix-turn-helix transcriptional regulator [Maribacter sp. 2-571]|uniref:MarR family winged helix-turn-helix transcriptional regulator n=1 Tax=Maribacter sp. 2-571 TaxID=3417569 RepID=UPI003D33E248
MNVEAVIKTDKTIPLESRTIIHLMLIHTKINEQLTTLLKPFNVSLQQFNVLRILRGQNGKPANLSTLNERMVTKASNTTRLVDKLLTKALVNRVTCSSNRRKVEITITAKGNATLAAIDTAMKTTEKSILHNFSKSELQLLNSLLDKF